MPARREGEVNAIFKRGVYKNVGGGFSQRDEVLHVGHVEKTVRRNNISGSEEILVVEARRVVVDPQSDI